MAVREHVRLGAGVDQVCGSTVWLVWFPSVNAVCVCVRLSSHVPRLCSSVWLVVTSRVTHVVPQADMDVYHPPTPPVSVAWSSSTEPESPTMVGDHMDEDLSRQL